MTVLDYIFESSARRPAGRPEANSPIYYRFKNIVVTVFVTGTILESLQDKKRSIFGHFRYGLILKNIENIDFVCLFWLVWRKARFLLSD